MGSKGRSRKYLKSQWARKQASLFSSPLLFKDVLMRNHQATRSAGSLSDPSVLNLLSARSECFAERNPRPKFFSLFSVSGLSEPCVSLCTLPALLNCEASLTK
jgi:hypothetical protein